MGDGRGAVYPWATPPPQHPSVFSPQVWQQGDWQRPPLPADRIARPGPSWPVPPRLGTLGSDWPAAGGDGGGGGSGWRGGQSATAGSGGIAAPFGRAAGHTQRTGDLGARGPDQLSADLQDWNRHGAARTGGGDGGGGRCTGRPARSGPDLPAALKPVQQPLTNEPEPWPAFPSVRPPEAAASGVSERWPAGGSPGAARFPPGPGRQGHGPASGGAGGGAGGSAGGGQYLREDEPMATAPGGRGGSPAAEGRRPPTDPWARPPPPRATGGSDPHSGLPRAGLDYRHGDSDVGPPTSESPCRPRWQEPARDAPEAAPATRRRPVPGPARQLPPVALAAGPASGDPWGGTGGGDHGWPPEPSGRGTPPWQPEWPPPWPDPEAVRPGFGPGWPGGARGGSEL